MVGEGVSGETKREGEIPSVSGVGEREMVGVNGRCRSRRERESVER